MKYDEVDNCVLWHENGLAWLVRVESEWRECCVDLLPSARPPDRSLYSLTIGIHNRTT